MSLDVKSSIPSVTQESFRWAFPSKSILDQGSETDERVPLTLPLVLGRPSGWWTEKGPAQAYQVPLPTDP